MVTCQCGIMFYNILDWRNHNLKYGGTYDHDILKMKPKYK